MRTGYRIGFCSILMLFSAVLVVSQPDEFCEDELVAYIDNVSQKWVSISTYDENALPVSLIDNLQAQAPRALAWNSTTGTLAFDGAEGIYVIDASSTAPELLTDELGTNVVNQMVWSGDGEHLAVLATDDETGMQDIYVFELTDEEIHALNLPLDTEFNAYSDIVWSPDAAYLAVTIDSQVGAFAELISTACLDEEGECVSRNFPLPAGVESSAQPRWLDEGEVISYYCGSQYCLSDATGTELLEVIDEAPPIIGDVSPCGGQVLQAESGDLYVVDLESETRTLIASDLDTPPYIQHRSIWLPLPDAAFLLENESG